MRRFKFVPFFHSLSFLCGRRENRHRRSFALPKFPPKRKKAVRHLADVWQLQAIICRRGDSNPHGQCPLPPQDSVSTNSTTRASINNKRTIWSVRIEGLEPSTHCLKGSCSTDWAIFSTWNNSTEAIRNLLVLVAQALLMPVLPAHLLALVYGHLMAFSLFSAGHRAKFLLF